MKRLITAIMICFLGMNMAEAQIQFHQPVAKSKKDKKKKDKKQGKSVLFGSPEKVEEVVDAESAATRVMELPATALPGYNEAAAKAAEEKAKVVEQAEPHATPAVPAAVPRRQPLPVQEPDGADVISVILPFNLASENATEDKMQMRSVEFYEGLLIAVDEAQKHGQKIEVQTFDIGSLNLNNILNDEGLRRSGAIIAPMESDQIIRVAQFAEANDIPLVSPFKYCKELEQGYPHVIQLNTSKTTVYDRLSRELTSRFAGYTIVFVRDSLFASQPDAYPQMLKSQLDRNGQGYYSYVYNEPQSVASMDSVLNLDAKNVLYVLETPQRDALRRFFPSLKNKLFLDANPVTAESDSTGMVTLSHQIAILGYPEWQTYTSDFMDYFYDLNVWMFSQFYVNPFEEDVQQFQSDFKYWYSRELMALYPKYGVYGYDVARFLLAQLGSHYSGKTFCDDYSNVHPKSLQTDINLVREKSDGCLQNRGLYLINFAPDATITKYEIR